MKHRWLRREGSSGLLLFFSGWGTDGCHAARILEHSIPDGFRGDMLACYDYRTLELDPDLSPALASYRRIRLVAWSFGVWAATRVSLPPIESAVAVNGTLFPIDPLRGIDPAIFRSTLEGYGEEGRRRFERRMCGTAAVLAAYSGCPSSRTTADQKEELSRLGACFHSPGAAPEWEYDRAVIGGRDAIFPAVRQRAAWGSTPLTEIPAMPHYPFFHCRTLREVSGWAD
ncbi:pimeloyl-ACP methyl esterase BioG family protein [Chlorobium sp. N1]|uniref:pimeloyl-ACP methyl esterase BioG family protein n=1 Tax=Chlorobium sp. N1 TaxID=2491138 RepID=UPI00103BBC78|nr:pimeloyl-ACP methyl esterase BioG family protein [Chlorobium sp. N1]TCD48139.1 DUF452 family protein [Chlorobium sp. N1]